MSDTDSTPPGPLKRLGNVHHAAFRCRDAEQTRWFYEEVLGSPARGGDGLRCVAGHRQKKPVHAFIF